MWFIAAFDDRNELTTTRRYNDPNVGGTTNADPNLNRDYLYDAIGNRTLSRRGTDPNSTYDRNEVNQYEAITTALSPIPGVQELHYDPDGNLSEALTLGDVDGDGDVDQDDLDAMLFAFDTCEGDPDFNPRANFDTSGTCEDPNFQTINQDDLDVVLFYFDLPSTGSIRATMTWDAENRLALWEALVPTAGSKKLKFKYDYMGRRVEKAVYVWDPNLGDGGDWPGSPNSVRRYVWRDWLRLMELDGSGNVLRKWSWGRDLSGTLEGAGGIGGLLSVHDANETPGDPNDDMKYVYFYDANGNVGQVVDLAVGDPNNTIKAKYEYDAYGNVTSSGGSYASTNAVRFSTKPWDDETGMRDWGRRLYEPHLGRWTANDPIGEQGGHNTYAFVGNSPSCRHDAIGLCDNDCWWKLCFSGKPVSCGKGAGCACPGDGESCNQDHCGIGQWYNPNTGMCEPIGDMTGPIYGNCCGGTLQCEDGLGAPREGDCVDMSCATHDQCLASRNPDGGLLTIAAKQCHCEHVTRLKQCIPSTASGKNAKDSMITAFCGMIKAKLPWVSAYDCPACN